MSKDWSPRELFYADKTMNFPRELKITSVSGCGAVFYTPSAEDRALYPNLSFLGGGVLKLLREKKIPDEAIREAETELSTILANEDIGIPYSNWIRQDVDESLRTTAEWFGNTMGSYYREPNDERFAERIEKMHRDRVAEQEEERQ